MLDLLVVGAGPAGLYATTCAGLRGLRVGIVDSLPFVGGQLTALYPETVLVDVPGQHRISASRLTRLLAGQASEARPRWLLARTVQQLETDAQGVRLAVVGAAAAGCEASPEWIEARAVLLTSGIGAFRPQHASAQALEQAAVQGVYLLRPPGAGEIAGQRVLVVGGGLWAASTALALSQSGSEVWLAHRRERLAVPAEVQAALQAGRVRLLPSREVGQLRVVDAGLRGVCLDSTRTEPPLDLMTDALVPCHAFVARPALSAPGLVLEDSRRVQVDRTMATSLDRVFCAGDAAGYAGKLPLLAAAFGEAQVAVSQAIARIEPGRRPFEGFSSHHPRPEPSPEYPAEPPALGPAALPISE